MQGQALDVLLVEDDPADAWLVAQALNESGLAANLHTVEHGEQALAFLDEVRASSERSPPKLVLLDWNLTRLHGSDVLLWIRSDPTLHDIPVVVLSASVALEDRDRARELGADEFAVKANDFDSLMQQVTHLVSCWTSPPHRELRRSSLPPSIAAELPREESLGELIDTVRKTARQVCRTLPKAVRMDAESAAMIGLMEALVRFHRTEGEHFDHYLHVRVRGAIRDEARRFDPLSRRTRDLVTRVEQVTEAYRLIHGTDPDIEYIALTLGIDEDKCWEALELCDFRSLPLDDDTVPSQPYTAEDQFVESYTAAALRWALGKLDQRSRLVLRLSYKRGLTTLAIARRLRISTARVHQIRVEAERRLAHWIQSAPPIAQMNEVIAHSDWDEHTEDAPKKHSHMQSDSTQRRSSRSENTSQG